MVRTKPLSPVNWLQVKARLTQEELDWLSQIASSTEDLPNEISNILVSLAKGRFDRTHRNIDLVRNMLTRLMIDFDDKDLEPNR